MLLLFLDSADTCRSVIAAGLLCRISDEQSLHVESAGFLSGGEAPSVNAVKVVASRGGDVHDHISRMISPALLEKADLVLCMQRMHVREAVALVPSVLSRTFTLKEFARRATELNRANSETHAEWIARLSRARDAAIFHREDDKSDDISDPSGASMSIFEVTADEIERCILVVAEALGSDATYV